MRIFWGLVAMVISVGITWLIQTKRLHTGQAVPGLPGTTIADLDPRKIVAVYKKSMADSKAQKDSLLHGELSPEQQLKLMESTAQEAAVTAANIEQTLDPKSTTEQSTGALPSEKARERSEYRYTMDIVRLSDSELQTYIGDWRFMAATDAKVIRLQIQPRKTISSVTVRVPPSVDASLADNQVLLWKDLSSGQVIVPLTMNAYLLLEGTTSPLKATLFRSGSIGTRFNAIFSGELQKTR